MRFSYSLQTLWKQKTKQSIFKTAQRLNDFTTCYKPYRTQPKGRNSASFFFFLVNISVLICLATQGYKFLPNQGKALQCQLNDPDQDVGWKPSSLGCILSPHYWLTCVSQCPLCQVEAYMGLSYKLMRPPLYNFTCVSKTTHLYPAKESR
jgi:hypothetical protein